MRQIQTSQGHKHKFEAYPTPTQRMMPLEKKATAKTHLESFMTIRYLLFDL
jgi:hypothetical protein